MTVETGTVLENLAYLFIHYFKILIYGILAAPLKSATILTWRILKSVLLHYQYTQNQFVISRGKLLTSYCQTAMSMSSMVTLKLF